ncbi:uncharacterized protein V1516DRAFT_667299 [Lipomyces oligophaga]|uniref:uncharacterized protein n=1 Tax=Lipomyces oligophaga TaxID=45792 RepID=UPI0034CF3294
MSRTVYAGTFVHSLGQTDLEILNDAAIGVDEEGTISWVDKETKNPIEAAEKHGWSESTFSVDSPRPGSASFYFPGFFDTHIHASQYPNVGLFGKTTLLDWLNTYTFPLEASFADLSTAKDVYSKVIARTLANGTTTAAYYATVHVAGTNLLADLALEAGQRAFIGRCCMNDNSPEYYCDKSLEDAQHATNQVIQHIRSIDPQYEIVSPIITPRFAISCTKELLSWLGQISEDEKLPVQTHISENKLEVKSTIELHPYADTYAGVYDQAKLLHDRTILAHAVHLSDDERILIAKRGCGVSHCPSSNSSLTSGETRVKWLLEAGIKVGLGTDVSGGFSPSILFTARQALLVSRHLAMKGDESHKLTIEEVLYLATLGGAGVCGLAHKLGNFVPGKKWDAQLITLDSPNSPVDIFSWERPKLDDIVAKWVFNGDDRNVAKVWINGKLVAGTAA